MEENHGTCCICALPTTRTDHCFWRRTGLHGNPIPNCDAHVCNLCINEMIRCCCCSCPKCKAIWIIDETEHKKTILEAMTAAESRMNENSSFLCETVVKHCQSKKRKSMPGSLWKSVTQKSDYLLSSVRQVLFMLHLDFAGHVNYFQTAPELRKKMHMVFSENAND